MQTLTRKMVMLIAALAVYALASASTVSAARRVMCTIEPFDFDTPIQTDVSRRPNGTVVVEWMAMGSTMIDCNGMPSMVVNVFEHAAVGFEPGAGTAVDRLKGRVMLQFMLENGRMIDFMGQVRGSVQDIAGNNILGMRIRARGPRGAKLELHQQGMFFNTEMLSLDFVSGFFDIFVGDF